MYVDIDTLRSSVLVVEFKGAWAPQQGLIGPNSLTVSKRSSNNTNWSHIVPIGLGKAPLCLGSKCGLT